MRKHNQKLATRFGRTDGDRTNYAQRVAHSLVNATAFQLAANPLLRGMLGSL